MTRTLVVTENDNGDSLDLPGEWSCVEVDYSADGNQSITTYEFERLTRDDCIAIEKALNAAPGVWSFRWE